LARQRGASWIVADGYHFGADYQRIIKEAGLCLLFIDDDGQAEHYYADIVLNQNLHARESFYAGKEPYTRLLLGIRYVLLRREFLQRREWKREIAEVARKVLVTLGGGDPDNVTLKVVQALQRVKGDGLEAMVVIGGSNPHYEELQSAIKDSHSSVRLQRNVTNMPELMAWADLAISSGGTTVWELAFMGLPALVGVIAPIEELLLDGLKEQRLFVNVGWFSQLSVEQLAEALIAAMEDGKMRSHTSLLGRKLVDGYGADRVLEAMNEKFAEK
ncbi:MAG: UDP-2,4-diacetamido-2,4,6-trideoxy-beta-L-altropyranose hydrolase, partial [bacterium]